MEFLEFERIFNNCMSVNRYWSGCYNPGKGEWISIEPKCIIRDFEVEMPGLNDPCFNETFDINKCDKEFTDLNKAWEYFKTLNYYRIMDPTGNIWADNYLGRKVL